MQRWYILIALLIVIVLVPQGLALADDSENIGVTAQGGEGICEAPTNFVLTEIASDEVEITWTMGSGADYTAIVRREGHYSVDRDDGTLVYNGTATSTTDFDVNLEGHKYYYRAWSYRVDTDFWSIDYAQGTIGGMVLLLILFGFLAMGLTGTFLWKKYNLLSFGCAGMWALLGFTALQQSESTSPTDITDSYMGLFWLCITFTIAFMLLPLVVRAKPEPDEIYPEELDEADKPLYDERLRQEKEKTRLDLLFGKVKPKPKTSNFAKTGVIKAKPEKRGFL